MNKKEKLKILEESDNIDFITKKQTDKPKKIGVAKIYHFATIEGEVNDFIRVTDFSCFVKEHKYEIKQRDIKIKKMEGELKLWKAIGKGRDLDDLQEICELEKENQKLQKQLDEIEKKINIEIDEKEFDKYLWDLKSEPLFGRPIADALLKKNHH